MAPTQLVDRCGGGAPASRCCEPVIACDGGVRGGAGAMGEVTHEMGCGRRRDCRCDGALGYAWGDDGGTDAPASGFDAHDWWFIRDGGLVTLPPPPPQDEFVMMMQPMIAFHLIDMVLQPQQAGPMMPLLAQPPLAMALLYSSFNIWTTLVRSNTPPPLYFTLAT
uniref:Uncharacterized protein n=1 Tax=Oryza glumipatula TaxID=40148 RepID=A0A0E0B5K6_9ORYZ